jgi:hypothetical protein
MVMIGGVYNKLAPEGTQTLMTELLSMESESNGIGVIQTISIG